MNEPAFPRATAHEVLAALYRQAGLVAAAVAFGAAVSAVLYATQPPVYASSAKVWVQTGPPGTPVEAADRRLETEIALMLTRANAQAVVRRLGIRDAQLVQGVFARWRAHGAGPARTVDLFLDGLSVEPLRSKATDATSNVLELRFECADPALAPTALQAFLDEYLRAGAMPGRRAGTADERDAAAQLAQVQGELQRTEDRIAALRSQGAAAGSGLKLDLDPSTASAPAGAASGAGQRWPWMSRLRLRLEMHSFHASEPQAAQPEAELDRLERQRRLDQERGAELRRSLDHPAEAEADTRVVVDAPDHPTAADGSRRPLVALLGPAAGLLLGLVLAGLRELGGDRLRSARDVERALGVPVLGAIPTLSAKARAACLAEGPGA